MALHVPVVLLCHVLHTQLKSGNLLDCPCFENLTLAISVLGLRFDEFFEMRLELQNEFISASFDLLA
jgi:hypothetical protein